MSEAPVTGEPDGRALRRGWTTGACATAATKSALSALFTGSFADPVAIELPGGQAPSFALAHEALAVDHAEAGIIKDAGDDPDVTHGALVISIVRRGTPGSGIVFRAGPGVGTVTKPGLPLAVGEPAINPVPRRMMTEVTRQVCAAAGVAPDIEIAISIRNGEEIAKKTWNPRLGILGGLSVLGTTGIVVPYSCAAWIHSIHRGVDVARALGLSHLVGATGDRSEQAARRRLGLPEEAYLDMGDFAGGLLKYVKAHPVADLTIAGGFAKITKLAQGSLDLHSARSTANLGDLAERAAQLGADPDTVSRIAQSNTANEAAAIASSAGIDLAAAIAEAARIKAESVLGACGTRAHILIIDRSGAIIGESR
ncbi:MAG TPA: cobalt-precorrin-5B (C(1))-methyltransferase [Devosiaceae bacterium]